MPREIVTETSRDKLSTQTKQHATGVQVETCPAPECNLSTKDVKLFSSELKKYMKLFKTAYLRVEQIQKSLTYLQGLLGNSPRKNVEQMALAEYEKVRDAASAEYDKVRAAASAEYHKVRAAASAEYEKVCAPAYDTFVSEISSIDGYVA